MKTKVLLFVLAGLFVGASVWAQIAPVDPRIKRDVMVRPVCAKNTQFTLQSLPIKFGGIACKKEAFSRKELRRYTPQSGALKVRCWMDEPDQRFQQTLIMLPGKSATYSAQGLSKPVVVTNVEYRATDQFHHVRLCN